jgi:murein L,D-transpeptidase YcbB/YkuD
MPWFLARPSAVPCLGVILALIGLLLASFSAGIPGHQDRAAVALRAEVARLPPSERYIADVYRARAYHPLWSRDGKVFDQEAQMLLDWTAHAGDDGLRPDTYQVPRLREILARADSGRPRDLARLDVAMSRALARYESDLRRPGAVTALVVTDPTLSPPSPASVLATFGGSSSLAEHLANARRMHPMYEAFRAERLRLATIQSAQARHRERVLLANMDRSRMLPGRSLGRYVLVDAASARLWLYEDGRPVESMRVVVGKDSQPTPIMAGMIRYAVFDPYWNMPADLVRDQLAPKVLQGGPKIIEHERLELLSDWTGQARPVAPEAVDWRSVAAGDAFLRVRQRPGPGNMMGRVKFMFPNRLGVYLHDTSDHSVFARDQRRLSAGCVRVEDAARLARWLGLSPPARRDRTDWRADLPTPIPVYITYFSLPIGLDADGRHADPYGRDGHDEVVSLQRVGSRL